MRNTITVQMTSGAASAVVVNDGPRTLVGLQIPAMTGTTMTFQRKDKIATSWADVRDVASGTAYSIPIGSAGYVPVDSRVFAGGGDIRIVANTNQAADMTIYAVLHDVN